MKPPNPARGIKRNKDVKITHLDNGDWIVTVTTTYTFDNKQEAVARMKEFIEELK